MERIRDKAGQRGLKLGIISGGRPEGVSSLGGVHGNDPFVARSRDDVVVHRENKGCKWYRGFVEAADRFTVR